ncbi:MAG: porin family protein [Bacteroidia bacterium]|nr:porin family protein [Bacteroidia bacterium]
MKRIATLFLLTIFLAGSASAQEKTGFAGRPITNNLFAPTGNTLHQGEFTIGIGPVEYGITENVQIGTNLLLFILQYYNADLKVSFINTEERAFAAGVGVGYFNLKVFGADAGFTSFSPYIAYSMPVGPSTRLHLGANYTHFEADVDIDDAEELNASTEGTSVNAGIEHSLSNKTKFVGDLGYDIEFEGVRLGGGVLWGWDSFRLKLGLQYFSPKGYTGYVLPYIGLWWRFDG